MMKKRNQYHKLMLGTISLIVLFIFIFSVLSYNRVESNRTFIVLSATGRLETVNRLAASSIKDYFDKIYLALSSSDYWMRSNPKMDPRFDQDFGKLIDLFKEEMQGNVDIRLVSKEGGLFYIPSVSNVPLADVHDRTYFTVQQHQSTKGIYISEPTLSRVTNTWGLPVSYPLSSQNHGMSVVFAMIDLQMLQQVLAPYRMNQQGSVMLVRQDGMVLATSPFDQKQIGKSIADQQIWKEINRGDSREVPREVPREGLKAGVNEVPKKDRVRLIKGLTGESRYYTVDKVKDVPVYVIASCSKDAVLEPWTAELFPNIASTLLFVAIFIAIGVFLNNLLKRLEKAMQEITEKSNTDPLTGLPNRRRFNEYLEREVSRSKRYGTTFSIAEMDIDRFKSVNDSYGHEVGDKLLVAIAEIMRDNTRETDIVARWGGEEFVFLFADTTIDQAMICLEKLRETMETIEIKPIGHVTGSFGLTQYLPDETQASLMDRADSLMYESKNNGRNQITTG